MHFINHNNLNFCKVTAICDPKLLMEDHNGNNLDITVTSDKISSQRDCFFKPYCNGIGDYYTLVVL
jgi:hypothetical protein